MLVEALDLAAAQVRPSAGRDRGIDPGRAVLVGAEGQRARTGSQSSARARVPAASADPPLSSIRPGRRFQTLLNA